MFSVIRYYLSSTLLLFRTPRYLLLCAVPWLIGIAFTILSGWSLIANLDTFIGWLPLPDWSWLDSIIYYIAAILSIPVAAICGILAMTLLGSFFIEMLVEKLLKANGLNPPENSGALGLAKSVLRGLKNDAQMLFFLAILLAVSFICSFFAPLLVIPPLLALLIASYDAFDLPQAILEVPFKGRVKNLRQNKIKALSHGGVFLLLMMIPLGGVIFLPIVYAVSCRILGEPQST